jgi:DNA-binding response OmpR family regulator
MFDSTILVVSNDRTLAPMLQKQLAQHKIRGSRMIASTCVDEACDLLQTVQIRVAVLSLDSEHLGYEEVDHILWATSILRTRVPVVVIADRYRVEQAITLYRMGVSEYVSRSHHSDELGVLIAAHLPQLPTGNVLVAQPQQTENAPAATPRSRVSPDLSAWAV